MDFGYIEKNLRTLLNDIEVISARAGVKAPRLVAVTKSGSDEELLALVRAGATAIGENRPAELSRRGKLIKDAGLSAELHQIGTLQSNKAKLVAADASLIHSLDSHSLARELDKQGRKLGIVIPTLIEINSAEEPQKGGVLPRDAEEFLCSLSVYENIRVSGLMTMGPVVADSEELRPYFKLTRELFDNLNSRYGFGESPTLSMGMSDSYGVAIEEGSTLVRVGRRLFIKE